MKPETLEGRMLKRGGIETFPTRLERAYTQVSRPRCRPATSSALRGACVVRSVTAVWIWVSSVPDQSAALKGSADRHEGGDLCRAPCLAKGERLLYEYYLKMNLSAGPSAERIGARHPAKL